MPLADFHRVIISTALQAARAAGFRDVALGGGNALIVRAGSQRVTYDVDFFCRKPSDLPAITVVIIEAIEAAGYRVERRRHSQPAWWDDEGELVELTVFDGAMEAEVQIAHFFYAEDGDVPGLGPVLSIEDIAGWKTTTVPNRMAERDFVDYALLHELFTTERLFELAAERDPGLTSEDYAYAARHLDRVRDGDLAPYLPPGQSAADVRAAFADWPRDDSGDA